MRFRPVPFNLQLISHTAVGGHYLRPTNPLTPLPLHELLAQLSPQEAAFFAMLDAQLEKVESFYSTRAKELSLRTHLLHVQLRELEDHKKLVAVSALMATMIAAFAHQLVSKQILTQIYGRPLSQMPSN